LTGARLSKRPRRIATGLVCVLAVVVLTAARCNEEELNAARALAHEVFTPAVKGAATTNLDAVLDTLARTQSVEEASTELGRLYRGGDIYEQALVSGFCAGMDQLADAGDDATGSNWHDFLVDYITGYVQNALFPLAGRIESIVNKTETTLQLAQVSGAAANFYVRACFRP
jgi:hypothetical protein